MSYDLMVFDLDKAPKDHAAFIKWYENQAEWSEDHGYNDSNVSTPTLQNWFKEMIQYFPPLNGPLASDDVDDPRVSDYCIGRDVVYISFSWPCAEEAYLKTRELAQKHHVGFFDVSGDEAEIIFPDGTGIKASSSAKPWWKFW